MKIYNAISKISKHIIIGEYICTYDSYFRI